MQKVKLFLHFGQLSWFKDPALKAIQLGTDSKYFHVGAQYDDKLICESTSKRGVDIRPLDHYFGLSIVTYKKELFIPDSFLNHQILRLK